MDTKGQHGSIAKAPKLRGLIPMAESPVSTVERGLCTLILQCCYGTTTDKVSIIHEIHKLPMIEWHEDTTTLSTGCIVGVESLLNSAYVMWCALVLNKKWIC